MHKSFISRLVSRFRRQLTLLVFLALGAAMLYGQTALLALTSWVQGVAQDAPTSWENMVGAELAAEKQASGWVSAGNAGSKFIVAAGFFFLFLFLVWVAQGITAPGLKKWAKEQYTAEFGLLDSEEQFKAYEAQRWQLIILAAAAIVAGSLIQ